MQINACKKLLGVAESFCVGIAKDKRQESKEENKKERDQSKTGSKLAIWGLWKSPKTPKKNKENNEETAKPMEEKKEKENLAPRHYKIYYQSVEYYPMEIACGKSHALILATFDSKQTNFSALDNCSEMLNEMMASFMKEKKPDVSDFMQLYYSIKSKEAANSKPNAQKDIIDREESKMPHEEKEEPEFYLQDSNDTNADEELKKQYAFRFYLTKGELEKAINNLLLSIKIFDTSRVNELYVKLINIKADKFNVEDLWEQFIGKQCKNVKLFQIDQSDTPTYTVVRFPKEVTAIQSIACGEKFSLALTNNYEIYSWGKGMHGELGLGEKITECKIPTKIICQTQATFIAAGYKHAFYLDNEGNAYSWGCGKNGRLGLGNENNQSTPTIIAQLNNIKIKYIAGGAQHSALITVNNRLYTWGCALGNRLGLGDTSKKMVLFPQYCLLFNSEIIKVSCGFSHTLALTNTGIVYSLGEENLNSIQAYFKGQSDINITDINAGMNLSFATDNGGALYGWGKNNFQMIGVSEGSNYIEKPRQISSKMIDLVTIRKEELAIKISPLQIVSVHCPENDIALLRANGFVEIKKKGSEIPTKIKEFSYLNKEYFVSIACGRNHILAITDMGLLYGRGNNKYHQAGHKEETSTDFRLAVNIKKLVKSCACGDEYSAVITFDNKLVMFGSSKNHTLGLRASSNEEFTSANELMLKNVKFVSCGNTHVLAITKANDQKMPGEEDKDDSTEVYSWGMNNFEKLGLSHKSTAKVSKPTIIDALKGISMTKVCCGDSFSLALSKEKEVYFWGDKEYSDNQSIDVEFLKPTKLNSFVDKIDDISVCNNVVMCLNEKREVYKWGSDMNRKATNVKELNIKALQICSGYGHHAYLSDTNAIMIWEDEGEKLDKYKEKDSPQKWNKSNFDNEQEIGEKKEKKQKEEKEQIEEQKNIINEIKQKLNELKEQNQNISFNIEESLNELKNSAVKYNESIEQFKINAESMILLKMSLLKIQNSHLIHREDMKKTAEEINQGNDANDQVQLCIHHIESMCIALKYHPCYLSRLIPYKGVEELAKNLYSVNIGRHICNYKKNTKETLENKKLYDFVNGNNYSMNLLCTLCKLLFIEEVRIVKESNGSCQDLFKSTMNDNKFLKIYAILFQSQIENIKASIIYTARIIEIIITTYLLDKNEGIIEQYSKFINSVIDILKEEPKAPMFIYSNYTLSKEVVHVLFFCINYTKKQLKNKKYANDVYKIFLPLIVFQSLEYLRKPKLPCTLLLTSIETENISYVNKKFDSKMDAIFESASKILSILFDVENESIAFIRIYCTKA